MGLDQLGMMSSVAAVQAGCFSVDQARSRGLSEGQLRTAERAGILERVHPRVVRFVAVEECELSRMWASVLQVGVDAAVSHEAALRGQGVAKVPFHPVISVRVEAAHNHRGIRVHRVGDLIDEHRITVRGLPMTTVERAVVDVATVFSLVRLADLVDRVTITERRTSIGGISRAYRQVNRHGRQGIAKLGEVLDERRPHGPTPRSQLEGQFDGLVEASGLPEPLREVPVPSLDEYPGLVDRAWEEAMMIVEIDGRSWHAREGSMATDRARDRAAGRKGWYTVRVLDEEVTDRRDQVIDDIVGIYIARLQFLGRPVPPNLLRIVRAA